MNDGGVFEGHSASGLNNLRHTIEVLDSHQTTASAANHEGLLAFNCSDSAIAELGFAVDDDTSSATTALSQMWLVNGNMESKNGWVAYNSGFTYNHTDVYRGGTSLRVAEGTGGATQVWRCNELTVTPRFASTNCSDGNVCVYVRVHASGQTLSFSGGISPTNITLEGWSKAVQAGGAAASGTSSSYSVYADIAYTEGDSQWGETARFDLGTHDWQFRSHTFAPTALSATRKVSSISLYLMYRNLGDSGLSYVYVCATAP